MNVKLSRRQTIIYVIMVLAGLLMLSVWPCNIIHRNINVKSSEIFLEESEPTNAENSLAQVFVADGNELESVNLYICNDMAGETVNFALFDGTLKQLVLREIDIPSDAIFPGMINLPIDYELEKGIAYIYAVSGATCDLTVGLQAKDPVNSITVGGMNYAGTEYADRDVIINFNYTKDFNWWQIIVIDVVTLLIVLAVIVVTNRLSGVDNKLSISAESSDSKLNSEFISVQRLLQFTLLPLLWVGTIAILYMIFPLGMFRTEVSSILFYYAGVLLFSLLITYVVCYRRNDNKELISIKYVKDNCQKWLVVIAMGHIFWYCFEYMNGLYEIHHEYAARRVLIWVLVMLIVTYEKKELINIINMIWVVAAGIFGYFYAKSYVDVAEQDLIHKLNAYIIVFGGLVLINMIRTLVDVIRKKKHPYRFDIVNSVIMAVFAVVVIAFSNTRWWPAYMVVVCLLISFRLAFWKDAALYLNYLCDGLLFNFVMMVAFSLLHRPYYRYVYYRYNMTYFTVTMTATHMSLVVCAALVKLIIKYKEIQDKRRLIPYLAMFGATACYQVFTLARTAFLCIGVTGVVTLIGVGFINYEKGSKIRKSVESLILMIVAVLIMFPITFTATRIVPALSDDPVIYEYEHVDETMYKGTPTDDYNYMDPARFVEVFGSKILGVGRTITSVDPTMIPDNFYQPILIKEVAEAEEIVSDSIMSTEIESETLSDIEVVSESETETVEESETEEDPYAWLANTQFTKEEWLHIVEMRDEYDYLTDEEYWLWVNGIIEIEKRVDVSNGRMDIYRSYLEQLNLWGHEEMGAILKDGGEAAHAHSIYLQILFDFGIIPGMYVIIVLLYMGLAGLIRTVKHHTKNEYLWLIPVVMLGFLTAGTVEWVYHACNPFGLAVMMAIMPMIFKVTEDEKSTEL